MKTVEGGGVEKEPELTDISQSPSSSQRKDKLPPLDKVSPAAEEEQSLEF
jgi:hypothetical protein